MLTADTIYGFSAGILAARYDNPKPIPNFHTEMWELACDDTDKNSKVYKYYKYYVTCISLVNL